MNARTTARRDPFAAPRWQRDQLDYRGAWVVLLVGNVGLTAAAVALAGPLAAIVPVAALAWATANLADIARAHRIATTGGCTHAGHHRGDICGCSRRMRQAHHTHHLVTRARIALDRWERAHHDTHRIDRIPNPRTDGAS